MKGQVKNFLMMAGGIAIVAGLSLFLITKTLAVATPYRPGETSDPTCARGEPNCTVDIETDLYKENPSGIITNTPSGANSVTIGTSNTASGTNSVAIGYGDGISDFGGTASGDYAVAIGINSLASGMSAVSVLGEAASGNYSLAIGEGTVSPSFRELSLGSYPTTYSPTSALSWSASDRLLNIGNGSASGTRSDIFTILKNGKIGIADSTPSYAFEINSTDALRLPSGTTAQRPGVLATGLLRYNSQDAALEYSNGATWISVPTSSSGLTLYNESLDHGVAAIASAPNSVAIGNGAGADQENQVAIGSYPKRGDLGNLFVVGVGDSLTEKNGMVLGEDKVGFGDIFYRDLVHPLEMQSGAHVTGGGVWTDASDRALKDNIEHLQYGLAELRELRPRSFEYKIDGSKSIGFVAQEIEEIIPEIVSGIDGRKGVAYGQLTAVLTNAVQELAARVEVLEQEADIEPLDWQEELESRERESRPTERGGGGFSGPSGNDEGPAESQSLILGVDAESQVAAAGTFGTYALSPEAWLLLASIILFSANLLLMLSRRFRRI